VWHAFVLHVFLVARRDLPEGLLALEDISVALLALLGTVANGISLSSSVKVDRDISS
jgi:hypothetical protein